MKSFLGFVSVHKSGMQAILALFGFGLMAVSVVLGGDVKFAMFLTGLVIFVLSCLWVGQ